MGIGPTSTTATVIDRSGTVGGLAGKGSEVENRAEP